MKKLTLLIGIAIGYILVSRAGRERFEQLRSSARKVASNPSVQSAASKAQERVAAQAPAVAEAVKGKVTSAASAAADQMHRGDTGESGKEGGTLGVGDLGGDGVPGDLGTPVDQPTVRP